MTDTQPTTPVPPPASAPFLEATDIIPPPDVQSLFDEATAAGHGIMLDPVAPFIRMVDRHSGEILREVRWDQAPEYVRRAFRAVAGHIAPAEGRAD